MDVNVEIDELVLDGADAASLQDRLVSELGPDTAQAVGRAVFEAVRAAAGPATSG